MIYRFGLAGVAASLAVTLGAPAAAGCNLAIDELPVTMVGTRPTVAARINGKAITLIADSGAVYSSLSPGAAAELGLKLTPAPFGFYMRGVGGDFQVSVATVKTFTVADASIPNVQFLVGGSEVGEDSTGLLGQNFLRVADVEYDLANGVIRLIKPQGCNGYQLAYWAKPGKFAEAAIDDATPLWPQTFGAVAINGIKLRAMFDTGAERSIVSRAAAKRAGIDLTDPRVISGGFSGGLGRRLVKTWIAPVDSFTVGGEEIHHTRLRVGDTLLDDIDMLLGADFFLSHRIYVANSRRKIDFTYNGGPVFDLRPTNQPAAAPAEAARELLPEAAAPTDAEGFSRRGAALSARGAFDKAIADLTEAVRLKPEEPRYLDERATAYFGAHQPLLAAADLDHALRLDPKDVRALIARAQFSLANSKREAAIADLDAASQALAKESDDRFTLGALFARAGSYEAAVREFDLWVKAHPDDSRQAVALTDRCRASGLWGQQLDGALSVCDRAVRINSKSAAPLDSRGLVRLRLGELDKAIADYNAALAIQPKLAWAIYGRGIARLRKGMTAEGKADIAAATALQPSLPGETKRIGLQP